MEEEEKERKRKREVYKFGLQQNGKRPWKEAGKQPKFRYSDILAAGIFQHYSRTEYIRLIKHDKTMTK